ncbi:lysophospholipid acyltransferase LPCAT4 [Thalassophryne amazonica]|uniref:lysophospholipid acyltransferase LPCAT4 n=1 Tax=Thalassophryne amazonica TaxID=390379 RepID=UPI001471E469|nr:lysophospholipid acyltransferase LPCAT4 [Thalassophryne amazonica]
MENAGRHSAARDVPNPFVHELQLSGAQRIKGIILGSILTPIRIILAILAFIIMWFFALLRVVGLSEEELSRPITGWRQWVFHPIVLLLSRAVFFFAGFLWVKVKGRRANLKEAPVLVVAPHSSFLDMLVLCPTQLAMVMSRSENASLPVIGALLKFNQSLVVSRQDPESRKKAVTQLKERLSSNGYWPQMLIFPEGTTTNGKALLKFKHGVFLAGVPVQPVLLHYPNQLDTVRWTYKGTSWLEVVWHTTSQLYTNMTVEFLPVYEPSDEEKNNPGLYADNVQKVMANALGIPATDYVMEGDVPVRKLGGLSIPLELPARETLTLLHRDGLGASDVAAALDKMTDRCQLEGQSSKVEVEELAAVLGLSEMQTANTIFGLYSKSQTVDLRQVCLSVAALSECISVKSLLHTAFTLFDSERRGSLTVAELSDLIGALLGVPQRHTDELYTAASIDGRLIEDNLLRVLTSHPTYQRVVSEYLQLEAAPLSPLTNGKAAENGSGSLPPNKKFE